MAMPYLDNPATLSETTAQELDGLVAKLNAYLGQQHNAQGGHGAITASSVLVDGPVTVRDERLAPASFRRTIAKGTQIAITPTPGGTTPWLTVLYNNVEAARVGQVGGVGLGLRVSDGVYQRGRTVAMGDWQDVPFNAADFAAVGAGNTWVVQSVDMQYQQWTLIGQTMHYQVAAAGTEITGAPVTLTIALPAGYQIARRFQLPFIFSEGGPYTSSGFVFGFPGQTVIQLQKLTFAAWAVTTAAHVMVSATFEVTG
jgi:hypothetical protein